MTRIASSVKFFAAVFILSNLYCYYWKKQAVMVHESSCWLIRSFREKSEGLFEYLMLFTHISRIRAFDCTVKGI